METPDTYLRRAETAERAADASADDQAKRMLKSAAERWRQLAVIAERISEQEARQAIQD
jgi:hypothetical protein